MNAPQQVTGSGVVSQQISSVRSVLLFMTITNAGASDVFCSLSDVAAVPGFGKLSSNRIVAGATWRFSTLDQPHGTPFTAGILLQTFLDGGLSTPASSNPVNFSAWYSPLQ